MTVDKFGNLITNIEMNRLRKYVKGKKFKIFKKIYSNESNCYKEVRKGYPLVINGSSGFLEVSVSCGNASKYYNKKEGDKVVVPPNYGHITINPFDKTLVMSNWVCSDFPSIYEPIKRLGGGHTLKLMKPII